VVKFEIQERNCHDVFMAESVSVIVPSLGRKECLVECVGAILNQNVKMTYEVIVVIDGANWEDAVRELQSRFPEERRIRYDTSPVRRGSPFAKNVGAQMSNAEILVFVDDDTIPLSGWLQSIVESYSQDVGGVGGSEQKQSPLGFLRRAWFRFWGDSTGKVTRSGLVISNFGASKSGMETVDCLAGANMSFRRSAFEQAGGFDSRFGGTAYREETDLCLRVGKHSRLVFVPQAMVMHREEERGGNTPESKREWNYWYHRNNTYFFLKNLGGGKAIWIWHQMLEAAMSVGRTLQQRSLTPLTTFREGTRTGKAAYAEYRRSLGYVR